LNGAKLYLILDRQVNSYDRLFEIARDSIRAGVDVIQLRDKIGCEQEILDFSVRLARLAQGKALFIVNDLVDIAVRSEAAGVHLGQDDMPITEARRRMGRDALIGISCQTIEQAEMAEQDGADYIGFGSVFKTMTKPGRSPMDLDILRRAVQSVRIPVFAIGGIGLNNLDLLAARGVRRVAVCREICLSHDVAGKVERLRLSLREADSAGKGFARG